LFDKYPPQMRVTLKRIYEEWQATNLEKTGKSFIQFATQRLGNKYYKEIIEIAEEIDKQGSSKRKKILSAAVTFAAALVIGLSKAMRGQED